MMLTTKQAAAALGVTDSRVRQLLIDGRLKGEKVGRDWIISEADIKKYLASNGK